MKILPYPRQARVRNTAMMQRDAKLQNILQKNNWKIAILTLVTRALQSSLQKLQLKWEKNLAYLQ